MFYLCREMLIMQEHTIFMLGDVLHVQTHEIWHVI